MPKELHIEMPKHILFLKFVSQFKNYLVYSIETFY